MIALTPHESTVLYHIKQAWEHCQELPTAMEIARASDIYYIDVRRTLTSLDEKGFIELRPDGYDVLWWE